MGKEIGNAFVQQMLLLAHFYRDCLVFVGSAVLGGGCAN
jgi:hypothetical protein